MSAAPDVSIVLSTRDRAERLGALLESLRAQTLPVGRFEVVVVDNGSADSTTTVLGRGVKESGLRLRVLRRPHGEGPAAARNDGWRAAVAPLVAFTDDDCEADPGWLAALLTASERNPGAVIQGRTEPIPRERERMGPFSRTQDVTTLGPWFQTCNVAYPRALLERLGGFDQDAFPGTGGEDTDLAWRAMAAGAAAVFADGACVFHAVADLGAAGKLRLALRWSDAMQVFDRHPGLRRHLTWGIFWKRSHALLAQAAAGALLARRFPPAALLAYPYLRYLLAESRVQGAGPALVPYLALHDAVETYAAARGAVRHRVLVL